MRRHETMTAEVLITEPGETVENSTPPLLAAIRAAKAGDADAFEEIMIATERRTALVAWRILGDAEEVKDAVQETFLRLFRHLGRFDERQDFFAWQYRIAVNVCRDVRKRGRRWRMFEPIDETFEAESGVRIDDDLVVRGEIALLTRAIDALPEKQRLAVILRDVEELPTVEVAAILGSRPATVRVQIGKARVTLRQWIESWRGGRK
jgi:RNA polymerase sigma-70 factor, ECF subfamily